MSAQHEKHPQTRLKHYHTHTHKLEVLIKSKVGAAVFHSSWNIMDHHGASPWFSRTGSWSWSERCCRLPYILWWCWSPEPVRRASAETEHLQEHQNTVRGWNPSHTHQKRKRREDEDLFKRSWLLALMSGGNMKVSFPDGDLVWPLAL